MSEVNKIEGTDKRVVIFLYFLAQAKVIQNGPRLHAIAVKGIFVIKSNVIFLGSRGKYIMK